MTNASRTGARRRTPGTPIARALRALGVTVVAAAVASGFFALIVILAIEVDRAVGAAVRAPGVVQTDSAPLPLAPERERARRDGPRYEEDRRWAR